MEYEQCERCKKTLWSCRRSCNCIEFEIDHDGELHKIYATDEESAAQEYAEKYDEDDHPLLNYGEITITVKNMDGETKKFNCSAEPTINYYANEITDC
jgi:hypothetical protein